MLPEHVQLWHLDEERLRAQSLEFIERNQALANHLELIHDAMYVLVHFCCEHGRRDDDEFAIQVLGIRLFNTSAAGLKLVLAGYCQTALHLLRDLLETANLLDYFSINPAKIAEWRAAGDKSQVAFAPFKIRKALEAHPNYAGERRDSLYKMLSAYASHPTFKGAGLLADDQKFNAGPFVDVGLLGDWLLLTAAWLGQGTLAFSNHLQALTPELQAEKAVFASAAAAWRDKFLVATPKPPELPRNSG